jgi:hypothetical protein
MDNRKNKDGVSMLSNSFHMDALQDRELLSRAFCVKQNDHENAAKRRWPKGRTNLNQFFSCNRQKNYNPSYNPTANSAHRFNYI